MTTDKLAGMAAIVKNLPYFGFGNLATLLCDFYRCLIVTEVLSGAVSEL